MESQRSTVGPELQFITEEAHDDREFNILHSPELRAKYVTLTDELIRKLSEFDTDVAIFLDKSARPVAWLVNDLWEYLAPTDPKTGVILKRPDIRFLNIDREQWGPFIGRSEDGLINVKQIPQKDIDDLRQVFTRVPGVTDKDSETQLTGKRVMVIDEVRSSGDTLHMAESIIGRAFPDAAEIEGSYWMLQPAGRDMRSGALISGEVPVWYSDRTVEGRLIANRDSTKSRTAGTTAQRHGALWLSTLFRGGPDEKGRQLKIEVKQLVQELAQHELPYMPSAGYTQEELSNRIQDLDGISLGEYLTLRKEATRSRELNTGEFINLYKKYLEDRSESEGS